MRIKSMLQIVGATLLVVFCAVVTSGYANTFNEIEKRANQGDAEAQCILGVMYEDGEGVARDDAKAIYWYEKSAEQGYVSAQFLLAVMYKNEKGVAPNLTKAAYWYGKAAA